MARMFRSHGMTREATDEKLRNQWWKEHQDLRPEFHLCLFWFQFPDAEINAVIGLEQLKRLDANNEVRNRNHELFLANLNPQRFFTH